jgi:hypothetical protein
MRWPRSRTRCRGGIGSSLCAFSLLAVNGVAIPTGAYMLSTLDFQREEGTEEIGKEEWHTYFEYVHVQPETQVVDPLHPTPPPVSFDQHLSGFDITDRTFSLTLLVGGGLRIYRAAQGENTQYGRTHFDFTKICTTK